jgi:hypothetical protein
VRSGLAISSGETRFGAVAVFSRDVAIFSRDAANFSRDVAFFFARRRGLLARRRRATRLAISFHGETRWPETIWRLHVVSR